ncbi:DNA polymerase nu-like [Schistocerca serialis cubense]|uniref:DNA polymerase nu-like n=1 Tax=Schistocerca serialis cubense TaxID=2023355 RepID=UPI00214F4FAD|nr:DNA polymerase nu-like [Schistocerca serialis cubense]
MYLYDVECLLKTVLNHSCRKICFCAQDFMMHLIKRFQFSRSEVCLKWILLDPLIGCWLLNPDKSFYFFSDVTASLGLKESSALKDEPTQTKLSSLPQALDKLLLCAKLLNQKLEEAGLWRLFLDIEMKLVSILSVMETRGICTNTKKLQEMQNILHEHLDNLQEQAYKEAGKKFQINSPQQLRNILYEELQLDQKSNTKVRETAKLGQKSTSEHVLSLLKPWHPLPGTVLQYRHLQKTKSTFIDGVLQQVVEGKVFPSWGQHCAATGRITSSNPNLQAIPKQPVVLKILPYELHRRDKILLLRSPYHTRDGYTLLSADFQHIELRMLAHLSKDPLLKEILQKPDDVFTSMSRIWLGKTQGEIETEDREKTKRIVYAVMYGAGPAKLAEFLNINHSEASSIFNTFLAASPRFMFNLLASDPDELAPFLNVAGDEISVMHPCTTLAAAHFPAIKRFSNAVVKECQAKECLHTITGRHRLFPNISSSNNGLKSYTERQAVNFLMQGSAADFCKCAMICTELEFLKHPELDVHLLIQIHDELVWEVKDENFDTVKGIYFDYRLYREVYLPV